MEAFVTFCARALVAGGDRSEKNWPSSKCPSCLQHSLPSIILQLFIFLAPSSNNSGLVFKVSDWNFDYIFNLTIFTQTSDLYIWTYMFNVSWCDVYFSVCWYYIYSICVLVQSRFFVAMLESGKVLDRWQVSLKCYCSMTGSLCNSQATWYCLFLSQSSTWCHFALFCESFLSRVCSVCWAIFAPAVVVACVEAGLLVTFLLFGLFDGWTHSTSPNPFRHPCHGRWQVLNLNKEVTNTVITMIISI